ncbi:Endo-chitosanase C [Zalerion maritima]|uniref:Endo-chitosanase C n=1 Tax=Zalerion maritima TaxID=339359 RepID=A0AAD5RIL7_9PEZI|nr:Endo-chitosanase C [Zalerion maritima]
MTRLIFSISTVAAIASQAVAQCSWPGHCAGDPCASSWDDCADDLICVANSCTTPGGPQTCSWAGHCIGAGCKTNDDCSDDLICHPDQNGCIVPAAIETNKWPFFLDLSCYEKTLTPECAGDDCNPSAEPVVVQMLQVAGEHFNIGHDNINVEVIRKSTLEMIFNTTVDGQPEEGKLGGYFEANTNIECPTAEEDKLDVYGYDVYSQKYRNEWFWLEKPE